MIDNQNKYNKERLFILLGGIPAVFVSFFLPKKKGRIILNSHFNESFDFNSKYLFLYMKANGYDVYFVINDDEYRKKLIDQYGDRFIETKTFRGKLFALRSKLWFISAFELPVGGIFLKATRTIVHLTHGSLIKNVGLLEKDVSFVKRVYYNLFVKTNISYSVATSDFFVKSTSAYTGVPEKNVLVSGFPRNDALFLTLPCDVDSLKNDSFKVLYAPTWRKDSNVRLFPFEDFDSADFEDFLLKNNITVYVRLHPYNEVSIDMDLLTSHVRLFSTDECKEIMDVLSQFECLITDYSSILYDFMLLDRPFILFPYDFEEYREKIGFAIDYETITPGHKPCSFTELKDALLDAKNKDFYRKKRQQVCSLCNKYREGSSRRLLDMLKARNVQGL